MLLKSHGDDVRLLRGILRGPGNYPTPSRERIQSLIRKGLVKKTKRATLRITLKGRLVVLFNR